MTLKATILSLCVATALSVPTTTEPERPPVCPKKGEELSCNYEWLGMGHARDHSCCPDEYCKGLPDGFHHLYIGNLNQPRYNGLFRKWGQFLHCYNNGTACCNYCPAVEKTSDNVCGGYFDFLLPPTTTTTTVDPLKCTTTLSCTGKIDGYYEHESNEHDYVLCIHQVAHCQRCWPNFLVYNKNCHQCTFSKDQTCGSSTSTTSTDPTTTTPPTTTTNPTTTTTATTTRRTTKRNIFS